MNAINGATVNMFEETNNSDASCCH